MVTHALFQSRFGYYNLLFSVVEPQLRNSLLQIRTDPSLFVFRYQLKTGLFIYVLLIWLRVRFSSMLFVLTS